MFDLSVVDGRRMAAPTHGDGAPRPAGAPGSRPSIRCATPPARSAASAASVAAAGIDAVLSGLSQWVASGAEWLLSQIGNVLVSTTTIDLGAGWFPKHYEVMTALAGGRRVAAAAGLDAAGDLPAERRPAGPGLLRAAPAGAAPRCGGHPDRDPLPLGDRRPVHRSGRGIGLGRQGAAGRHDEGADRGRGRPGHGHVRPPAGRTPGCRRRLRALAGAPGARRRGLRGRALPPLGPGHVGLALGVALVPSPGGDADRADPLQVRHRGDPEPGRGRGGIGHSRAPGDAGSGFASVLAGGALLVLATFVPFSILRLIPMVEAGAVGHLEGARQRAAAALTQLPRTAAQLRLEARGRQAHGAAKLAARPARPERVAAGQTGGSGVAGRATWGTSRGGAETDPSNAPSAGLVPPANGRTPGSEEAVLAA